MRCPKTPPQLLGIGAGRYVRRLPIERTVDWKDGGSKEVSTSAHSSEVERGSVGQARCVAAEPRNCLLSHGPERATVAFAMLETYDDGRVCQQAFSSKTVPLERASRTPIGTNT